MMPEMDGNMLCQKIKQNTNINHIPVVLLTARSKPEDRMEGLEIGADAYLVKPFNIDLLRLTISNLINNREILRGKFNTEKQVEDKMDKIHLKSNDEILMEKIMRTINEHLADPTLNVEVLAANAGMSRVHMHRKLKELTNQSARDFIRGIRLKQAASLLKEKNLTISEVAYATGFSNLSHFSNTFKEFYGVSPTEYKEQSASQM
jgi:AraC-like DNA-binding protein